MASLTLSASLSGRSVASLAVRCDDVLSPGEDYEHWCRLEADHPGDHRCGHCNDRWNPAESDDLDEFGPETHSRWDGTCPECQDMRRDDEAGR
ncbi:hypothetical protein [Microbacterium sp. GXF6406]